MIKSHKLEDLWNIKSSTREIIKTDKKLYGEVLTPLLLINRMFDIIPIEIFQDPNKKWLDPGTGTGHFSIVLYFRLLKSLELIIPDLEERKKHIIKNMIYMVELRSENIIILKKIFGEDANIYEIDFLYLHMKSDNSVMSEQYDVIIGNPPFNSHGLKKVPTNYYLKKRNDGSTIWSAFIIKSIGFLKSKTGILCIFIPSIWLKPDKERIYYFLNQYSIKKLTCFSNTETNKIFKGNAQTPSCFFLLTKKTSDKIISIFDISREKYIDYHLKPSYPIPVFGISVINKIQKFCTNNAIKVIKTNLPSKNTIISLIKTAETPYANITTCLLNRSTNAPKLIINYSDRPLYGKDQPKIILAHKMYGFPYLDISGTYGISSRDNYIIIKENLDELKKLQKFLSTKTALYLYETTRYRMKYLEKYVFQLIPDITTLTDFPIEINDETIANYFNFDKIDRDTIQKLHNKTYKFFI